MIRRFFIMCLIAILISPSLGEAAQKWLVELRVSHGDDSQRLILGGSDLTTDDYDIAADTEATLAGYLMAYFDHSEWGRGVRYYWTDIRGLRLPQEWNLFVASSYLNKPLTFNWDVTGVPATLNLTLVDEAAGKTVDMRTVSSYVYTNTSTAVRMFTVNAATVPETGEPKTDITPPDTIIASAPGTYGNAPSVNISFRGMDDISGQERLEFSYTMDDGGWSDLTGSTVASFNNLNDGEHTFSVKARDEAGNEDQTPAEARFIIDTQLPVLVVDLPNPSVLWPPNGKIVDVSISGNAMDNGSGLATVSYTINDEYWKFSSSGTITPQDNGNFSLRISLIAERNEKDKDGRVYTIAVNAVDRAGNLTTYAMTVLVPHDIK